MSRTPLRRLRFTSIILLTLIGALRLAAQGVWTTHAHNGPKQNLWSIAFDNNTLIAVGEFGLTMYSDYEGIDWQQRGSNSTAWLVGVGFGNNRWIAVGDRGTILVSDNNGATWSSRASGTTARLNAVAYGNDRWLVVGEQGTVLTSPDGNTWTVRPARGTGFLRGLAFGQGRFVFGGAGGALHSTADGAMFTGHPIATTANIEAVAITSARFFIAGSNGLLGSAPQLDRWEIASGVGTDNTFRGLVARSDDDATAIGDRDAYSYSGTWRREASRPAGIVTAAVQGRDETIAVGLGGLISRTSSLYNITVTPGPITTAAYGSDVRLTTTVAAAASNLPYQWRRNGVILPGETRSELFLRAVDLTANGNYTVSGTSGGTLVRSSATQLIVTPAGRPEVIDLGFNYPLPAPPIAVTPQADGRLLVTGVFSPTNGRTDYNLVRLNTDGSIDSSFRPVVGADAGVPVSEVSPQSDGRIYVRGNFTHIAGQPRPGLARLLSDGSLDASFVPTTTNGAAYRSLPFAAPDGRLYLTNEDGRRLGGSRRVRPADFATERRHLSAVRTLPSRRRIRPELFR
jgi:hypothetical protein